MSPSPRDPAGVLASDYFYHLLPYSLAVCKMCRVAIWPSLAVKHLRGEKHRLSRPMALAVVRDLSTWTDLCPGPSTFTLLPHLDQPLPQLPLFRDGLLCLLDPASCTYVGRTAGALKTHWQKVHSWSPCGTRGGCPRAQERKGKERWEQACRRVLCQRFFHNGPHSGYFQVRHQGSQPDGAAAGEESTAAMIMRELRELEAEQDVRAGVLHGATSDKEVSPWLEMTRWPVYLAGKTLRSVAELADLPTMGTEPVLHTLCDSLDRLVQSAYSSVCSDRINAFDQVRINSFMQRPRAADRPLLIKLQKPTYHRYKKIWKGLLCFAYRATQPSQPIRLSHQLSARQGLCLDHLVTAAIEAAQSSPAGVFDILDRCCLEFCISLLDHDIRGSLFDSVVVGFLAALGIDRDKDTFREACGYGPILSGFIKISQMLVIQKAVWAAEAGEAEYPSELLDEMHERFLAQGTRSPFGWANRLRIYAKKVRDQTTSLGYIDWDEGAEAVSYKDISCLSMADLKRFIAGQVADAQKQLEGLLLLHPSEELHQLGVGVRMHRLVDSAVEGARGYGFLQHPNNLAGPLPDRRHWLLERVLQNDWLLDEFVVEGGAPQVLWKTARVQQYMQDVDAFLERLLLLVHLTSGQPARGTELLSLRYINTIYGQHRNIFIDSGMVSTVTTYHKGYSVSGSIKIIHRYLPSQVGELMVYYLWLVLPFWQKLDLLALHRTDPPSPFVWPKGQSSWDSSRLSVVLKKQFTAVLGQPMNIPVYRHLAIAISRRHLSCGGFKRDYGTEETAYTKQASHGTWTAGSIYARGLEEAAGHVTERRMAYRSISKEWHEFLGFAPAALPAVKRPLADITNAVQQGVGVHKRARGGGGGD